MQYNSMLQAEVEAQEHLIRDIQNISAIPTIYSEQQDKIIELYQNKNQNLTYENEKLKEALAQYDEKLGVEIKELMNEIALERTDLINQLMEIDQKIIEISDRIPQLMYKQLE